MRRNKLIRQCLEVQKCREMRNAEKLKMRSLHRHKWIFVHISKVQCTECTLIKMTTDWKTKNDINTCLRLDKETSDRKAGRNDHGTTPQSMMMTNIRKVHKWQNDNKKDNWCSQMTCAQTHMQHQACEDILKNQLNNWKVKCPRQLWIMTWRHKNWDKQFIQNSNNFAICLI